MKSEAQKTAWLAHTSIRHQYQQTTASSKCSPWHEYEASIYDDENEMVITISPKQYSMGVAA